MPRLQHGGHTLTRDTPTMAHYPLEVTPPVNPPDTGTFTETFTETF